MKRLATLFTCSLQELRRVQTVTLCAMMGAIGILLGSLSINIGSTLRIGFSGIPNEVVHYLFGPATGSIFAGVMDILKYMVNPTGPYFPGFTLVPMLAAVIYGYFYYKKPVTFKRVLAAHLAVSLVCNILLNTLFLSMLYGKGFMALLPARVIKNLVSWPVDSLIFYEIARVLELHRKKFFF